MKIQSVVKIAVVMLFAMVLFSGQAAALEIEDSVDLSTGTFTFHPSNNASASYTVNCMTVMGALEQAQNDGILTYGASDSWYPYYGSFYLTDINGISDDSGANTSWFLYINGEYLSYGFGLNSIEEGEVAQFYYCEYDPTTWEPLEDEDPIHTIELEVI